MKPQETRITGLRKGYISKITAYPSNFLSVKKKAL